MSWPTRQIGELFDLENGFAFKSADFLAAGVPVIKIKNVKAGHFSEHDFDYVSPDFRESRPSKLARVNDLLISMSGNRHDGSRETWVGKVAHFNKDGDYFLNQRVGALRLKSDLDENTRFFGYLMSSMPYQELFISIATSSGGQANLSPKQIFAAEVAVPPKKEQDAIASVLGALDDKIELNRRMNETLEETARALFRDWFVDFGPTRRQAEGATDPTAIMGHAFPPGKAAELAPLFPAGLGDDGLPEGWGEQPFEAFVDIVGGGTPKTKVAEYWGGDIPWFSVVDAPAHGAVYVHSTEKSITTAGLENSSARMVPEGTTIISARGTVGKIGMASRDMTFNQSCYALRPKEPVGERFVFLATGQLVERLQAMAHGSVFSTITRNTFSSLSFAGAEERCYSAFEGITAPLFAKIKANGQENQTLAEMRDLLLPKLMSGDIRLKDAEKK
ncbi:restriction endonuclease subunit S [uncultured Maricaulis sp.]|uniref:restriction endonuclease subunit S n=1 Tax=uncultured Maricaulis sp. TaxID=174710 RepID=UPI0025E0E309|nr:restriction endonuclease subunit S [uncultured Maricaulis sp.]